MVTHIIQHCYRLSIKVSLNYTNLWVLSPHEAISLSLPVATLATLCDYSNVML